LKEKFAQKISMGEVNRLALPAIASGIAEPLIALVDNAFIGHIGKEALGGIGLGSSLFLLFVWTLTQTKTAMSAIVSRHYGAGTTDTLARLVPQALATVFGLGLLVYLLTSGFSTELLRLYSAKGEVLEQADIYFGIRAIGFPLVLCTYTMFGIFRGLQNTAWAMKISIAAGLINLVLDPILIFGIEGLIAPMGIAGAAWASLAAQIFMLSAAVITLLKKTPFRFQKFGKLHEEYGNLLGLSSSFILRTIALTVTFFLANRFATGYGDAYIAAHTIAINIWLFSSYFIDGYANAGNALAGRLLGSGDQRELYRVSMHLLKISIGIGAVLSLCYLVLYPWIGHFFTDDQDVLVLFNSIFWMVIIAQPLNAIAYSMDGTFKGLGQAKYLMKTLLIAAFLGFIPALLIGDALGWKLMSIWVAFMLFMGIRGGSLLWKFRKDYS
jgi:putative MATE family efflux protein